MHIRLDIVYRKPNNCFGDLTLKRYNIFQLWWTYDGQCIRFFMHTHCGEQPHESIVMISMKMGYKNGFYLIFLNTKTIQSKKRTLSTVNQVEMVIY